MHEVMVRSVFLTKEAGNAKIEVRRALAGPEVRAWIWVGAEKDNKYALVCPAEFLKRYR